MAYIIWIEKRDVQHALDSPSVDGIQIKTLKWSGICSKSFISYLSYWQQPDFQTLQTLKAFDLGHLEKKEEMGCDK